MRIKRLTSSFTLLLIIAMVIMAVTAMLSFSAHITPQKCEESGTPVLYIDTEGGKKIKTKEKYVKATYSFLAAAKSGAGATPHGKLGNFTKSPTC